jgi:Ydr279p protein family (RNase H2 complex component) wHTH domain
MNEDDINSNLFRSFFVAGQFVVSDSNLYTLTPVDTLFWLLRDLELPVPITSNSVDTTAIAITPEKTIVNHSQWQPLNQLLASFDTTISSCLQSNTKQLNHIFATMNLGEDEIYYKFSVEKSLQWLTRKQKAVEAVLLKQQQLRHKSSSSHQQNERNPVENYSTSIGSFSKGFNLSNDHIREMNTHESLAAANDHKDGDNRNANDDDDSRKRQCYEESIQLVCHYLTNSWRVKFIGYLHLPNDDVLLSDNARSKKMANKKRSVDDCNNDATTASSTFSNGMPPIISARPDFSSATYIAKDDKTKLMKSTQKAITSGAKRLQKVNTKGMQKMNSFFTAKKSELK